MDLPGWAVLCQDVGCSLQTLELDDQDMCSIGGDHEDSMEHSRLARGPRGQREAPLLPPNLGCPQLPGCVEVWGVSAGEAWTSREPRC